MPTLTAGFLILLIWLSSATPVIAQPAPSSSPPRQRTDQGTNQSVRDRIRDQFIRLHHADSRVAQQSGEYLQQIGLTNHQIALGRRLIDPDPEVRVRLARSLGDEDQATQSSLLRELIVDPNEYVRIAVLEALQKTEADFDLRRHVRELATTDPNPIVRGHARLLASDWEINPAASTIPTPPVVKQWHSIPTHNSVAELRRFPQRGIGEVSELPSLLQPVTPYWLNLRGPTSTDTNGVPEPSPPAPADALIAAGAVATWGFSAVPYDPSLTVGGDATTAPGSAFPLKVLRPPDNFRLDKLPTPIDQVFSGDAALSADDSGALLRLETGAPLGFSGRSGVLPTEEQQNSHFVPVEDRWRSGFPEWDRYGTGHPPVDDYPYLEGHWWDPYNQNVLKGDYPIIGQHTFLEITATSLMVHEFREVPTATTPFESTRRPNQERFFGDPFQYAYSHNFILRLNLFHGNEAFKPVDWQVRVEPVFNVNHLKVRELAVVNPDVRRGTRRTRNDFALEEWFVEAKIADLSPYYDFASVRAGSQLFTSDFRGFIFSDINRAVRLFGTRFSNRDQFNIIWFDQTEKETNSELNTFDDRHQNTFIVNYFRQDFIFPGYTGQISFHYNRDQSSFKFDENDFLVRPDAAGVFLPHQVDAYYLGFAGDGHIGRINITNAFFWVLGTDSMNPIAGRAVNINAQMAAVELSYDRDWARFRASFLWASGDDDPNDGNARGFDSIFDNPNFAGGEFSYWQRQAIRLFGVNLVQRKSIVPDLRSSKIEGQSNFVNPGLFLVNAGIDVDVTPKLKLISNANFLWFDSTEVLETFTFQDRIEPEIGADFSLGIEYRPFLNDNVQIIAGFAWLVPGDGLHDLFGKSEDFMIANVNDIEVPTMFSHFLEVILTF